MSKHQVTDEKGSKGGSSHRSRKFVNVTVYFLDDSSHVFQVQSKAAGQVLFEKACKFINLLEVDYFCLEFEDERSIKCWLDVLKPLYVQIPTSFPTMYFRVKFYNPDPAQLEDEFTRYLFGLQLKKDLAAGLLQCNDNTAAVMASYIIQADLGDYDKKRFLDSSYLSSYKFIPYQDAEIERKIMENHMKHIGQSPAEADLNLLETARRCELYGIKMTAAKDHEGVPLNLAVSHVGVLVFQNFTKINTFSWSKIRKLSFKRKKFLVKLHPEGYGYLKDTAEYYFEGRNECKNFWKKCIENHTFFRCTDAKQGMRQKPKIFSRGSSFRYSGRTQKQVSEFVRENCLKRQPFQRSTSLRTASSSPSRTGNLGSPQPIIPTTSQSCGSISDAVKDIPAPPVMFSTSEPTTPHVAQDSVRSVNGDCTTTELLSTGLVSPDFVSHQEGFQSPDFLGQDTDDNISHDSYHVLEKETMPTNLDCMLTNPDISAEVNVANTDCPTEVATNGIEEKEGKSNSSVICNGKINGISQNNVLPNNDTHFMPLTISNKTELDNEQKQKIPSRHRVRVFSNNICVDQVSPTLYARANHCISNDGQESQTSKAYPHTVDFVYVNQLPAVGSFSYKDDSVEVKSPQQIKFELLQWKLLRSKPAISSANSKHGSNTVRSKQKDSNVTQLSMGRNPLPVDLLSDISPSLLIQDSNNVLPCGRDLSSKESALKVIAANHDTYKRFSNSSRFHPGDGLEGSFNETDQIFDSTRYTSPMRESNNMAPLHQPSQLKDQTTQEEYNYLQQVNFLDVSSTEDVIDHSNQYGYTTYRFSHIGRPLENLTVSSNLQNRGEKYT